MLVSLREITADTVRQVALQAAFALGLAAAAAPALAHDTWFHRLSTRGGLALLALGTGNRFPVQEFAIGAEQLSRSGCRSEDQPVALTAVRVAPKALLLRALVKDAARSAAGAGDAMPAPVSCWAQLVPFEVELTPETAALYLDEIAAPAAVRTAWADMRSRGVTTWESRFITLAFDVIAPAR